MGDARLDYNSLTYGWFDHFLKGEDGTTYCRPCHGSAITPWGLGKWQYSGYVAPGGRFIR